MANAIDGEKLLNSLISQKSDYKQLMIKSSWLDAHSVFAAKYFYLKQLILEIERGDYEKAA